MFKAVLQVAGAMQVFRIEGTAPFGPQTQKFSKDIIASDKADATHRILSIIGSKHRLKRRKINIDSCKKIKPSQSQDPFVIHYFREQIAAESSEEE